MDLDRNHDNENPHLAVLLPEIATNIVTFLPKSDLISSCTLINSTWEHEARKRFALSWFLMNAENVAQRQEMSSVWENYARNIAVSEFPNLSREGPCGNFISTHGHKVKRLQTRLLPSDVTWPQYFETLSNSFPNLTSIALVFDNLDDTDSPQKNRVFFTKVKHLAIYTSSDFEGTQQILRTQLVPLFPNLVTLLCQTICPSVVRSFLKNAPTLTSLTLINTVLVGPIREHVVKLTRLEIGNSLFPAFLEPTLSAFLEISSGTLEYLRVTLVANIDPHLVRNYNGLDIFLPILPKLRVFELVHNDFATRLKGSTNSLVTPAVNLKFEGSSTETRLIYAEQFPVLETLRILKGVPSQNDKLTEQEFYEASVSFLYNSFLHPSNEACLSLRDLVIPFRARGEMFKFFNVLECLSENGKCFKWKDPSEVLKRVIAVFPNLIQLETEDFGG
ncbi:uncharacterized protein LOC110859789 [Folsomia candida]|uniref:F-box domain-containing protein n=1 Tax=Folsomia candida TaxID=158441 RepID=A0A226EV47_FOLCA|nr:uncharacterized protein LOC110859789 [Folsomia candida]XP_021964483.1 uncharacterized protein LOC110859789 [Folsomia candida]XP_035702415.1 uncharacterized protein LOC110859789 [Folsomia candida]XP_035702416.1 uncharacterized protein LOC110859789 [Folsomia candida]OXA61483.1 hypothetical protein Fcan01_00301 [Folsomia candida]